MKRLLRKYGGHVFSSDYRAAGQDQWVVQFASLQRMLNALEQEPAFLRSIREMNLRLMRRGGTIYSPYHCFDLAQEVWG